MTSKIDLKLKARNLNGWSTHALEFENDTSVLAVLVRGTPANIQTKPGRKKILKWQQQIATEILKIRGDRRSQDNHYVISLGIRFLMPATQKQPIDVDNYIKPIFAGIACGLFIGDGNIPSDPEKFKDFDDSHFDYLYVERLMPKPPEEGVVIVVSQKPGLKIAE